MIWSYTALTGWPASAIRASVMLSVVVAGWALKRPSNIVNSLFAAALIILAWDPQQLFQAGFQLSFFVVLCLILILPQFHEWSRRLVAPDPLLPASLQPRWRRSLWVQAPVRFAGDTLLTSLAAWIGNVPLVALYFHIVTPVSTPANLLAVPLCGLVLISNLASLLLAGWFPAGAELFNHAGWFLMDCIRNSSHWFAAWPKAYFYASEPGWFAIGLYYAVLLSVITGWLWRPRWRAGKFAALGVGLCVWAWQFVQAQSTTLLTLLPLGGGHAIYCDTPWRRQDILINCGSVKAVEAVTKPFLCAQGVNRLSTLVLTLGEAREMGGAKRIADFFRADQVCASAVRFRSTVYRQAVDEFRVAGGKLSDLHRGQRLGPWSVLHPDVSDNFPQADDKALVLYGNFAGMRILLLSDLGRLGQDALLEREPQLRADIVVGGIPVQSEPLCETLLKTLHPRLIIVADSEYPATARARPKLRERLAGQNVPVLYTRETGALTLELDGSRWQLRGMDGKVTEP
jgi:competence protein ComEC